MAPPHDRETLTPLGRDLAGFGDRVAIVTDRGELTYRDLAARVARAARRLGPGRRLVLLAGGNTVDAVVAYLGALAAGHPVLLVPADDAVIAAMVAAYDPDVVVRPAGGRWTYDQRRRGSAHELHPELALLLSTSGSTGSPKLVRLSHDNLRANAESIAEYLGIRDTDRAATTLPMHYCYGLSVLNSHLVRGAGLILTERSVADTCFWEQFRAAGGTSFAGVPYTFALLDRAGFDTMRLPGLRYVTQAGGRLAPERVRHYAELGRRAGWDLVVMYGQTEATARMAYLPPGLAADHPGAIGVAVPGGSLRLEPVDGHPDPDVGELVYTGPNVMLGYAHGPADLALGRVTGELRTGDLARRGPGGLFEIVGRSSRFAKVFGLRIDLQRVEAGLELDGVPAACAARDDELVVVVEAHAHRAHLGRIVAQRCALPARAVRIVETPRLPRTASGKVDQAAVAAIAAAPAGSPAPAAPATDLCALYAEVLDRPGVTPDDSFVTLGGDSLSYVEVSVRLEAALGRLPAGWHTMPIRELTPAPPGAARSRRRRLDTSVALRAAAIVLIAGTHIGVFTVRGGAHLLLAVAGFNFARFHLTGVDRRRRLRHLATSIGRIAVPTVAYLAFVVFVLGDYDWRNALLLNEAIGPRTGRERYFWFIETLVYILVALLLALAAPLADRWERRRPFLLPAVLLGAGLLVRYDVVPLSPMDNMTTPASLFWLFALGWAAGKAATTAQRALVTAAGSIALIGYFGQPLRESIIAAGLVLLVWVAQVPSTAAVNRLAGALAGSSLYIYLTHWQVYPLLENHSRPLALVAALAAGVLFGAAVDRVTARLARRRARTPQAAARAAAGLAAGLA
ncbi:AMP-binding protein, partial [Spirilliplanes yamanashiensis]|uniref:AMP-binding protein n=1 Tax=Spirilliplanes yamanashiensis TaxID=42233 RepID=UPI0031DC29D0